MRYSKDFESVTQELMRLYNLGLFVEALKMVEQRARDFPEQQARTTFWRICLLSVSGSSNEALALLEKGLDEGLWWHESQFLDTDFNPIRGMPEFKALVVRSQAQFEKARGQTKPDRVILVPDGDGPYPLLIAIHGRGSNKDSDQGKWEAAQQRGWLVLLPQSTQALFPGAYCWDDTATGITDVLFHLDEVLREYPVNRTRILFGGFSQGSGIAIMTALQPKVRARGFIGIGTWCGDMESLIAAAKSGESPRGYFLTGLKDQTLERAREIQAVLKENGISFEEEVYPDLGHEFPPDFEQAFERALSFIFEKQKEQE